MGKRIEALRRGLLVLDHLGRDGPQSLASLARATGLPKPTLLRILDTLEATGHVRRGLIDGLWRATVARHDAPLPGSLLAEICAPLLDRLCQRILWPSDIGIHREGTIRILETSRRLSPFLGNRTVADSIHVFPSAMGRAILAFTSEADRDRILAEVAMRDTPHDRPARDAAAMARLVAEVRAKGYGARNIGYYVSAPREAQVSAIAVPVMMGDIAIAAINLSWVARAMTEAEIVAAHLDDLRSAAGTIASEYAARGGMPDLR
ncbi:helix-turn-helix domain-containing protein [Palleronia sp. LCG004]|uniref:helix-turn-helix domain-containing protein n=1 Tax=Palleronia sp. LCG004 TaxID=3079304 RepID=UPI002941DA47|nr:helix-turn-helix domain-containing protein [Palleronia sp. LCG004]WOI55809.1 helix-turn-helix domain-containing protein [Palleronia sp. LCG004]